MNTKNLLDYYNLFFPESRIRHNDNLAKLVELTSINFSLAKSFYELLSSDNKKRLTAFLEINKSIFLLIPIKDMDSINYKLRTMAEISMRILYKLMLQKNPENIQYRNLNGDVKSLIGSVDEWNNLAQIYGQHSTLIHTDAKMLSPEFSLNKQISKKRIEYHTITKVLEKQIYSFYYLLIKHGNMNYTDLSTPCRLNFHDVINSCNFDSIRQLGSMFEEK